MESIIIANGDKGLPIIVEVDKSAIDNLKLNQDLYGLPINHICSFEVARELEELLGLVNKSFKDKDFTPIYSYMVRHDPPSRSLIEDKPLKDVYDKYIELHIKDKKALEPITGAINDDVRYTYVPLIGNTVIYSKKTRMVVKGCCLEALAIHGDVRPGNDAALQYLYDDRGMFAEMFDFEILDYEVA